ncbi:F-box/kelch-repeat protein At3g06240-like [Silene latifolia]|uniref:F-box/kelch-repeat protein At3g06240-like n=1 Tax=Silene latifolia TaxID=37657 RepID=UPI003D772359
MKNPTSPSQLSCISKAKYLPPEICTHILSTLPAKTLLKFRCVCKSWCSIIDDPDFVHLHFQLSQINYRNNDKLVLALEGIVGYRLTVRDAETLRNIGCIFSKSDWFDIIGSCNGLLFVGRHGFSFHRELRLWNPSIRKSFLLPACPLDNWRYLFGFAPDSQDYKVVAFTLQMYFAVYTLRNQQWIVIDNLLNVTNLNINNLFGLFSSLSTSVFLRGATYWVVQNYRDSSGFIHLGSFGFDEEKLTFLKLPFSRDKRTLRFLFLLGESLAIFSISETTSSIWALQQDDNQKEQWILWFSGKSSLAGYEVFSLCYKKCRKVFYCEGDGGYFVCGNKTYNIASCQVQELREDICSHLKLEPYLESLVLSKGYGARDLRNFP